MTSFAELDKIDSLNSTILAAVFALFAGIAWGTSDFTGGMVTRRIGAISTMFISYLVALIILVIIAFTRLEPLSAPVDLIWGALAGIFGMVGLDSCCGVLLPAEWGLLLLCQECWRLPCQSFSLCSVRACLVNGNW